MCIFLFKVAPKHKPPTSSGVWWRRQLSVPGQEKTHVNDDEGDKRQAPVQSLSERLSRVILTHVVP